MNIKYYGIEFLDEKIKEEVSNYFRLLGYTVTNMPWHSSLCIDIRDEKGLVLGYHEIRKILKEYKRIKRGA